MTAVSRKSMRTVPGSFWPVWLAVVVAMVLLARPSAATADPPEQVDGLFITVQTPLTTTAVNHVIATTQRFLDNHPNRKICLVYDFNPDGAPSATVDYGPCRDLANFILTRLSNATSVAFVHNQVSRHAVLPVLACSEIVMADDEIARLGPVFPDGGLLAEDEKVFYQRVARARNRPTALILKMVDPKVSLLSGTRNGAVWYVDAHELPRERQQGFVEQGPVTVAASGSYTTAEATKVHLCNRDLDTRREIKDAYGLPSQSLEGDPLDGRTPIAWRVIISGPITSALEETVKRRVGRAVHRGANLIVVQLECTGGDPDAARDLADYLHNLRDDQGGHAVMTVAYVTALARDLAAFIALRCTEIVIDSNAQLGDFERYRAEPNLGAAIRKSLIPLAIDRGYAPCLIDGMFEPSLEVDRVRNRKQPDQWRLMKAVDLKNANNNGGAWQSEGRITYPIRAKLALELGLSQHTVDGKASEAIRQIQGFYGIDRIHDTQGDWLDEIATFLRLPVVSVFLVLVGITGLILELKIPGVGLPGVISALCFVLYFWAHSQLGGSLWVLALLLFVLGLILIGLEIFVLPGLGILGISGVILIIASLALATFVKKPETTQEWLDFGKTMSLFACVLIGAFGGALVLGWYIPHVPYVSRLILTPPGEHTDLAGAPESLATAVDTLAPLLGTIGTAITVLRPAGMARFGDQYVDVIAEGSYVQPGTRVQVVEIEGNRVVVKEV